MLVDIGVNLVHRSFDRDRDAVIERAIAAGVTKMIVTGTSIDVSRAASALAGSRRERLLATAGVHPHHAKEFDDSSQAALRALARDPWVVAIGECGLDFNRNYSTQEDQEHAFTRQIDLAVETRLPLFLHERDAAERMLAILTPRRAELTRAVIHCFTGTAEEVEQYIALDLHIGITGWICDERRGKHLLDVVKRIPLERLMLETDAPFLMPRSLKRPDTRNEPAYLTEILRFVAEARGAPEAEIARATSATADAFFSRVT